MRSVHFATARFHSIIKLLFCNQYIHSKHERPYAHKAIRHIKNREIKEININKVNNIPKSYAVNQIAHRACADHANRYPHKLILWLKLYHCGGNPDKDYDRKNRKNDCVVPENPERRTRISYIGKIKHALDD